MIKLFISQPMNGRSNDVMADADLVYFCDGWKDTRGCWIEHLCAKYYNKEIRYI